MQLTQVLFHVQVSENFAEDSTGDAVDASPVSRTGDLAEASTGGAVDASPVSRTGDLAEDSRGGAVDASPFSSADDAIGSAVDAAGK